MQVDQLDLHDIFDQYQYAEEKDFMEQKNWPSREIVTDFLQWFTIAS